MENMQLKTWRLCVFLRLNEANFLIMKLYVKCYELSILCSLFGTFPGRRLGQIRTTCTWMKMNTEQSWNDTESGKQKYSKKILLLPHCPPQISYGLMVGSNPSLRGERQATSYQSYNTASTLMCIW